MITEPTPAPAAAIPQNIYNYAANLLVNHNKTSAEAKDMLVSKGMTREQAVIIVDEIENQIIAAKKSRGNKDMLYGALWCVGGIVLTAAHIGFIFWGAIVFGAIQFFRGLINSQS